MLYEFLMVSAKDDSATRIREELELNKLYRVHLCDASSVLEQLKKNKVDCLVFNFEAFTTDKAQFAQQIRQMGYNFPVINFATHVHKDALNALNKIDKTVLIEKPFESKDVWGIAQKLVQGKQVVQRVYRRFYTDQKIVIEKSQTGDTCSGQVFNMSRGGAYIEVESHESIHHGDILKLTVPLEKVSKSYVVDVEVVWKAERGYWQGRNAVGVKFIKNDDIYRNLLNRL